MQNKTWLKAVSVAFSLALAPSALAGGGGAPVGIFGTWEVTDYRLGNAVSAGGDDARLGRTVTYSASRAMSDSACNAPTYSLGRTTAGAFLEDHRTSLSSVGIGAETVETVTVRCAGNDWTEFGGAVFVVSDTEALTVWDGVYYVLERR